MFKPVLVISALSLSAVAWQSPEAAPFVRLKEETMFLEYTVSSGEAVVLIEAEAEASLRQVEMRDPRGNVVLDLRSGNGLQHALQGFVVETTETDYGVLLSTYPEGMYVLRARTRDGHPALGMAHLSHEMPEPATVLYPVDDAEGVPVDLTVEWVSDPSASGYRVILEQGETDGLIVNLPPGSSSFTVPEGVLMPGRESHVEVGVVGENGNCIIVEVEFTTR